MNLYAYTKYLAMFAVCYLPAWTPSVSAQSADELNAQVVQLYRQGRYEEAIPIAQRVIKLRKPKAKSSPKNYSTSLNNLALLLGSVGAYEKAEPLQVEANQIDAKTLGTDHPSYALGVNNLATLYHTMGMHEKAEPLYIIAEGIQAKSLGTNHPDYGQTINNMADLYRSMGAYGKADLFYAKAINVYANHENPDHSSYATVLNNYAGLHYEMGAYKKAENLYVQTKEMRAKALGTDHPSYADSLNNLAELYTMLGAYEKALPLNLQAKDIFAKAVGTNHIAYATSLNNLAGLYTSMGTPDKAVPLYAEAENIISRVLGAEHPFYATTLNNLSTAYYAMGNYEKAEPLLVLVKEIRAKILGAHHPDYMVSLNNLASLYVVQKRIEAAAPLVSEAQLIQRVMLDRVLGAFPEKAREHYVRSLHLHHLSASMESGPLVAESLIAFKGAISTSLLEDKLLLQATIDPRTTVQVEKLYSLRSQFQHAALQGRDERSNELFSQIEALEQELGRVVNGLGRARRSVQITTKEVKGALPADTALVELLRYRRAVFDENKIESWQWRYGAAVVRHEREPTFINLALATDIDEAVIGFRNQAEGRGDENAAEQAARRLYDLVLKRLEPAISDATTVVFSPDSQLHFISFDALLDGHGMMACEKWNIRYVGTGRDLLDKPNPSGSRNKTALLLGDPLYGQNPDDQIIPVRLLDPSTSSLLESLTRDAAMPTGLRTDSGNEAGWHSLSFGSLPGTSAELLKLGILLEANQWNVEKLLQSQASESSLRNLIQGPTILHLATHGFFVNAPKDNTQDRNPVVGSFEQTMKALGPPTDPMLRSGMALTGAQHTLEQWKKGTVPDPSNDGMLLAAEVANYNLTGTELVVLSACETAKGKALDGEGIYGLRRALKMAGADSVVMTLWPVNDAYTVDFMKDFYTRYLNGMHPCRALAETKKEHLLKLKADPNYGYTAAVKLVAPFIATGKGVEAAQ